MEEHEAIARLKRGDISGLAALVQVHQVKAVRTATLITRDRTLAEDVVQATFIKMYERIAQFDERRPFEPYFMRSVVNAALSAAKKQQRVLPLDAPVTANAAPDDITFADLLPDTGLSPAEAIEHDELKQTVRQALDQLTPDQRAVIVMRYYLDMSESDMSDELNAPAGTVKWRLHAARKRLRGLLNRLMQPAPGWEM